MYVSTAASGVASHPEAETGVPSDNFVLVGGGFRVDWYGAGNIGTTSFLITEFSWKACSKDHGISDAINDAKAKAIKHNVKVNFVVGNILQMERLFTEAEFDIVIDSGLFHVMTDEERPVFV